MPNLIREHALILHHQQRQNLIIIDAHSLFLDRYLVGPWLVEPGVRSTRAQHPVLGSSFEQDSKRETVPVQVVHGKPSVVHLRGSREPLSSLRGVTDEEARLFA